MRNPATGVNLPRVVMEERRYLTHEQVELLARACASPADLSKHRRRDERENDAYRLVVLFLAYTGVRFGELAALRVGRLDFLRRRAVIVESVTLVNGVQSWGTPKGHAARCRSRRFSSRSWPRMLPDVAATSSCLPVCVEGEP